MYDHLHVCVITSIACEFRIVTNILQKWQKESDVEQCHLYLLNFLTPIVT